ncbi:MAG: D-aminoacylase [Chloroflexota bacterium]|nr:D-aminoacylase [Chloroflexota bacterium]MDE3101517.1 D-aminoacylase [Chloroflexota bacterium]
MDSLLLRGGTVVDGTGAAPRRADVLVREGRIAALGSDGSPAAADRVLDVSGMVVAPGAIDIHSHSDERMFVSSAMESALHQGVTTVVCGNCGGASAPVLGLAASELDRDLARYGVERTWTSFGEYAAAVERNGTSINVCSFVGHGTLRMCVMGAEAREATAGELAAMRALLASSLAEGAIGMSTGLIYPPSAYGSTDEIAALASAVRERGGLYASHIRNEGDELLEAVAEGIEIGRRSGVRVQLSHHKASVKRNWGKVHGSTALIERAQADGIDVTADQYPYTASSTGLSVTIPNWAHAGGPLAMCERLRDAAVRVRIRDEYVETGRNWDAIVIARAAKHPEWSGKSVAALAGEAHRDALEWTCDALIEHDGAIDIVHHSMSEDDVRFVMAKPYVAIGSDSSANAPHGPLSFGKPHPRSYGTFPRVLGRYARDEQVVTLEEAVRKMTSLPASRLRLHDRGVVREGAAADLMVFDPARVADRATYQDPHRYPDGIALVLVNGEIALEAGEATPVRAGRFLRRGTDAG